MSMTWERTLATANGVAKITGERQRVFQTPTGRWSWVPATQSTSHISAGIMAAMVYIREVYGHEDVQDDFALAGPSKATP